MFLVKGGLAVVVVVDADFDGGDDDVSAVSFARACVRLEEM